MKVRQKITNSITIGLCIVLTMTSMSSALSSSRDGTRNLQQNENNGINGFSSESLVYRFDFPEPSLVEIQLQGIRFSQAAVPGCILAGDLGTPALPDKVVTLLVPQKMTVSNIVVEGEPVEIDTISKGFDLQEAPLVPNQPQTPLSSLDTPSLTMDQQIYSSLEYIPHAFYQSEGVEDCCGYQIVTVHLFPVRYTPASGKLEYYPTLTITLEMSLTGEISQFYRGLSDDAVQVRALVDNPEILDTYTGFPRGASFFLDGLCDPLENYKFVIITNGALNNTVGQRYNWSDLLEHRRTYSGLTATKITVEAIDRCPAYWDVNSLLNDSAAHVRAFIKDAYQNWGTKYVILGGDWDTNNPAKQIVPARIFMVNQVVNLIVEQEYDTMPCDLYYSNLHGTWWDSVHDVWGGGQGSDANDNTTEVYVGRLTVDSAEQVSNCIGKIIWYDQCKDTAYLQKAVFFAGDDRGFSASTFADSMEEIRSGNDPNFYQCKGFEEWNNEHQSSPVLQFNISERRYFDWGNRIPLDYQTMINNDNACIINHLSHGNPNRALDMGIPDLKALTNSKYFFAISQACLCGRFIEGDTTEKILLCDSPDNGAFAVVFNTGFGLGNSGSTCGPSQYINRQFWDYLFTAEQNNMSHWTLGGAQFYSKNKIGAYIDTWNDWAWVYTFYCSHLFGDPAQAFRLTLPGDNMGVSSIEAPDHVGCNQTILVDTTLVNNGFSDEHDVVVSFRVNGEEVETTTISSFEQYTTQHVSFIWNPYNAGMYSVTINVTIPGVNEVNYDDNEQHRTVIIGAYNENTGECFETIQQALDNLSDGENRILVPPGVYRENLMIIKNVNLRSMQKEVTIIDGCGDMTISVQGTSLVNISGFTIMNGTIGISIIGASHAIIHDTIIRGNTNAGVTLSSARHTCMMDNIIRGNTLGVFTDHLSSDTLIYQNNFNNTVNAVDNGTGNHWDNGYPAGGNYWSDYCGDDQYGGPGQNESGPDGIGDTNYTISGDSDSHDHYPLKYPFDTLVVNLHTGITYQKIQDAIIDPQTRNDHVIFVKSNIYYEHLVITKRITLRGEDKNTTIIDGEGDGSVVTVTSNGVTLTGFTIQNSGWGNVDNDVTRKAGVQIQSSFCNVIENIIMNNKQYGIFLQNSNSNNILHNNILSNNLGGIYLATSASNNITGNTITNSYNGDGIYLKYSPSNQIIGNTIETNGNDGIYLSESSTITILNNNFRSDGISIQKNKLEYWDSHTINNNFLRGKPIYYLKNDHTGGVIPKDAAEVILVNCSNFVIQNQMFVYDVCRDIQVAYSTAIRIQDNMITTSDDVILSTSNFFYEIGICLIYSERNSIARNTITNTASGLFRYYRPFGIQLYSSTNNSLIENVISKNYWGIGLSDSPYNKVTENLLSNNQYGVILDSSNQNPKRDRTLPSNYNTITRNTVMNSFGIYFSGAGSDYNCFFHNNFISNIKQTFNRGASNRWFNAILQQGNYWDDYEGADVYPPDGIGTTPYNIPGPCFQQDLYPLLHRFILGDMNVDGQTDFGDINPFVLALTSPTQYQNQFSMLPALHGDINQDGKLNFGDINPFIKLLTS